MEFLNLSLIAVAGWLVWFRPERETLARVLLATSVLLMMFVFGLATRTSWLPGLNY